MDGHERYDLLCRATDADAGPGTETLERTLGELEKVLRHDLVALAQRGSPDDFSAIYFALEQELERFREFCAFPALAQKFVVGFGGAFSSGKSSLINALLGRRLLATEVDPTTTLPTFLLGGEDDDIHALNIFRNSIRLSHEEFLSLTHEEKAMYGSNVGRLLSAAFRTVSDFPWANLALADTPGYSKPDSEEWSDRTDEHVARAQLNATQAIVWVVSGDGGVISEKDLEFLSSLNRDIPFVVAVSRADKKPAADIAAIVALIRRTLMERNLSALDVIPLSARNRQEFPLQPLMEILQAWNAEPRQLRFAHNFKRQFTRYARYLEGRKSAISLHLNRLNRIAALAEDIDLQADANELREDMLADSRRIAGIEEDLHRLRQRFFTQVKQIGDLVGIPMPEPAEIDLMALESFDLLGLLRQFREEIGMSARDVRQGWRELSVEGEAKNRLRILRKCPLHPYPSLLAVALPRQAAAE